MIRKRHPWVAALFSLLLPGLGQLYAGHPRAAVAGYAATIAGFAVAYAISLFVPGGPAAIILAFAIGIGTYLAVALHAWRLAARQPSDFVLRPYNRWYVYVAILIVVSVVLGPWLQDRVRSRVQAFRIPSGAMEPTLLIGDFLFVVKTQAARTDLAHGTVVVFESVEEPELLEIKRVVGLPGDTLMMRAGTLHRNGQTPDEPYAIHVNPSRTEEPEERARMRSWQVAHLAGADSTAYEPDVQDWGPIVVPPESFFALGDNRDASYDSRYYGFVPMDRVIGQPHVIYFSLAKDGTGAVTGVRWSRLGTRLR